MPPPRAGSLEHPHSQHLSPAWPVTSRPAPAVWAREDWGRGLPPPACGHSPQPQVWPQRSIDDTGLRPPPGGGGGGRGPPGSGAGAAGAAAAPVAALAAGRPAFDRPPSCCYLWLSPRPRCQEEASSLSAFQQTVSASDGGESETSLSCSREADGSGKAGPLPARGLRVFVWPCAQHRAWTPGPRGPRPLPPPGQDHPLPGPPWLLPSTAPRRQAASAWGESLGWR